MNSGSILVYGSQKDEHYRFALDLINDLQNGAYTELIEIVSPDIHIIDNEGESIGIDEVHEITRRLSFKPYNGNRVIVCIFEAQNLTVEAQNAFLKTLEEPADYSLISLYSSNLENLLPTIISRCRLYRIDNNKNDEELMPDRASDLLDMDLIERFSFVEKLLKEDKSRVECLNLIDSLERYFHQSLITSTNYESMNKASLNLKQVKSTRYQLMRNANSRISLENLFLKLER